MEAGDLDALRATFERRAEEIADPGLDDGADNELEDDDSNVETDSGASQDGPAP